MVFNEEVPPTLTVMTKIPVPWLKENPQGVLIETRSASISIPFNLDAISTLFQEYIT